MELFYTDPENVSGDSIILDDFERKHLKQVLRKDSGDVIHVTDGKGNLFTAKVISLQSSFSVTILNREKIEKSIPNISIACGYIRPNRLDFLFEKGCEVGASDFHLVKTQFANYFSANTSRYQRILRQAIKQSQQFYLPGIMTFDSVKDFLNHINQSILLLIAIDSNCSSLYTVIDAEYDEHLAEIILLVGPEGGFSKYEIDQFISYGFIPVSLGGTRLRTETAALSGLSVINLYVHQAKGGKT